MKLKNILIEPSFDKENVVLWKVNFLFDNKLQSSLFFRDDMTEKDVTESCADFVKRMMCWWNVK